MPLLSSDAIAQRLKDVPGWEMGSTEIRRRYAFDDFKGAMAFVGKVAALAEAMNHHPDILIEYDKVTLVLSSHDAGGLTERDFRLAARIDA